MSFTLFVYKMMYINALNGLILSLLVSFIACTIPTQTPTQSFPVESVVIQTAAPALPKRDTPPSSVCGYFSEAGKE